MTAPTSWLLDTNILSEMMGSNPEPRVAGFLDEAAPQGIGLAAVTVWEILDGIGLLAPGKRRDDIADRFQGLLDDLFEDRLFDWTAVDARICARIMEDKRRKGEPLDSHLPDAMLAATAIRCDSVIVTRNESEFRNTGAKVANPWTRESR